MFTDQQKRELMYFKRRPTMISGTWMETSHSLSLWTMDRRDTLRAAQKISKFVWNEHVFAEKLNLAAREVQFNSHVLPGASTLDIKNNIQTHLNWQSPDSFEDRIILMSMLNDIEWTQKGNTETCLHNANVAAFATQIKPLSWRFLEPVLEKTWWYENSNEPHQVSHFTSSISATEPPWPGQMEKEGINYHFEGTYENKKILINTMLAGNLLCIYKCICQWHEPKNWFPPRRSEEEETSTPSSYLDCSKTAVRCYKSQRIPKHCFGELLNMQNLPERWKLDNPISPMNLLWMGTVVLFYAENTQSVKAFSKFKIANNSQR